MENIIFLIDIGIALLSVWVLTKLNGYGGVIGKSLNLIGYGIITIGLSQFFETAGLYFFSTSPMSTVETVHFVHHFVLLSGMILVFWGFKKLMDEN